MSKSWPVAGVVPVRSLVLLVLSALAAFGALLMDKTVFIGSFAEEGPPHFDGLYPLWCTLLALSGLLFVLACALWLPVDKVGDRRAIPEHTWPAWTIMLLSIAAVLLFVADPRLFYSLAKEDQLVETLSAVAAFVAGGVLFRAAWLLGRRRRGESVLVLGAVALAAVLVLLGLEEISWFQRVFGVHTPEWMMANFQHETNLHNFATDTMEIVYYFGAFAFLVAVPFVQDRTGIFNGWAPAAFFVPSRYVLFTAAIAFAWNYDMWNIVFTQLSFWTALFVLVWYAWSGHTANRKALCILLAITYCVSQVIFIVRGDSFVRWWDVSEYKELFIPLAFLQYALETLVLARRRVAA